MDYNRRFGGIARLYGSDALDIYRHSNIAVVGVGGVGSWAVEALARSGIGKLTFFDMDHVAESNINRQLPALDSELGKAKVMVLAKRVEQINPNCIVEPIDVFIEENNQSNFISNQFDYLIDCIDSYRSKASLISYCKGLKIPVLTVGGAGGKLDPTKIRQTDLSRSEQDPLLSKTRKLLRKKYNFPANLKRRFDVPCVFSLEQQKSADDLTSCGIGEQSDSTLNCSGFGSCMTVTASFGLVAVSHVLKKLATKTGDA
jgi:tRNA A37 threonylcarbamoyladenosine dehydratase